jgi:hypothetical protein
MMSFQFVWRLVTVCLYTRWVAKEKSANAALIEPRCASRSSVAPGGGTTQISPSCISVAKATGLGTNAPYSKSSCRKRTERWCRKRRLK